MNGYVLAGKGRQGEGRARQCARQQEQETLVDHEETSADCEGTEIHLTELRNV
jgi:hypothetical protein